MVGFLFEMCDVKGDYLGAEERNLCSSAFKSLISARRTALRTLKVLENNMKYQKFIDAVREYKMVNTTQLILDCEMITNGV